METKKSPWEEPVKWMMGDLEPYAVVVDPPYGACVVHRPNSSCQFTTKQLERIVVDHNTLAEIADPESFMKSVDVILSTNDLSSRELRGKFWDNLDALRKLRGKQKTPPEKIEWRVTS